MIKIITLNNWKSFRDAVLHIDPLTVLIGANASGKSNALDALAFLNRISSGLSITSVLNGDANISGIRGGLEWAPRKPESRFTLGVICSSSEESRTEYHYKIEVEIMGRSALICSESLVRVKYRPKTDQSPYRVKLFSTDPCDQEAPSITARLHNEKRGKPVPSARTSAVLYQLSTQMPRQEIVEGIALVLTDLKNLFILDPIPSHMREVQPLSDRLEADASNVAGVLAALPDQQKQKIESVLANYIQHIPERDIHRVYAEKEGKFEDRAMLYCDESWGGGEEVQPVEAKGLSDGTLRFLAILTALLTRPEGSLLVVEEIDNGLHPSRSSHLLRMLKEVGGERSIDLLLTTHNPALLDVMGTEIVPFVTVSHREVETGVSELTLLEELETLPKLLALGTIGKLSSQGKIEDALREENHA